MDFALTTVVTTILGRFIFLKRALDSINLQTYKPQKIIIISQALNKQSIGN